MGISKRLLALLAGGSAVGVGAAGAAVTSPDTTAPEPVEAGGEGTALDIEGDQVRVDAQASALDDVLDSASVGGVDTGTPDSPTPSPDSPTPSPDSPTPSPDSPTPSPDSPTPSPDTPTPSPDTPTPSPDSPSPSPDSPESADS